MRLTKKAALLIAGGLVLLAITVGTVAVIAIFKIAPTAKTWVQEAISRRDLSIGQGIDQLAKALGSGPAAALLRVGIDPSILASVGAKPEFAALLGAVSAAPQLGAVIRDGAYREALAEGVRQKVSSIMEIQLDRAPSPEVRDAVQRVQAAFPNSGAGSAAAAAIDTRMLAFLSTPDFGRLLQDVRFADYLIRQPDTQVVD